MTIKIGHKDDRTSSTEEIYSIFVTSGADPVEKSSGSLSASENSSNFTETSFSDGKYLVEEDEDEKEENSFCCGLCCFQGCIWGVIGALYFFLIIPAAIMLILHGYNQSYPLTLILGGVLLVVSTCGLPTACYAVRHQRRKRRKRMEAYRKERNSQLKAAAYEHDVEA